MKRTRTARMNFNDEQLEALNWNDGPLLVSAGPGSGKTRIIVARIHRMLHDDIDPGSILATTFTTKAAGEMNQRLKAMGTNTDLMTVRTMHSFCNRLLQRETYQGWNYDDENKYNLFIKQATGFRGMKWRGVDLSLVENFISLAKNALVRPDQAIDWSVFNDEPFYGDAHYVQAYFEVEELRRRRHLYTPDDMLIDAVELLDKSQMVREQVQAKYKYVIVDEFQDSNLAQVRLVEHIAIPEWNLMVVGDVDQAVYEWRGAVPKFMIQLQDTFITMPEPHVVSMGKNYRSASNIVEAAAQLISHNKARITKSLKAHKTTNAIIRAHHLTDLDEEANYVADEIITLHEGDGLPYGSIFVLYRTNAQSRAIEEVFSKRKIPHVVLGSASFYQRKEIQDVLAYLKLIVDPMDVDAGERALNRPFRFIAKSMVHDVVKEAESNNISFEEAVGRIARKKGSSRLDDFLMTMLELRAFHETRHDNDPSNAKFTVGQLINHMVVRTKFIEYLTGNEGSDTAENSREANIGELIRSADRYTEVSDFIEFINWQIAERKKRKKRSANSVTCMTIHKAKGAEARAVFMIGVNEDILPHKKASEPKEEERRLYYVGMTRAMEFLFISAVEQLGMEKKTIMSPSRFIGESGIDLEVYSQSGGLFAGIDIDGKEPTPDSHQQVPMLSPSDEEDIIDDLDF